MPLGLRQSPIGGNNSYSAARIVHHERPPRLDVGLTIPLTIPVPVDAWPLKSSRSRISSREPLKRRTYGWSGSKRTVRQSRACCLQFRNAIGSKSLSTTHHPDSTRRSIRSETVMFSLPSRRTPTRRRHYNLYQFACPQTEQRPTAATNILKILGEGAEDGFFEKGPPSVHLPANFPFPLRPDGRAVPRSWRSAVSCDCARHGNRLDRTTHDN